jgi:hypothetical protein
MYRSLWHYYIAIFNAIRIVSQSTNGRVAKNIESYIYYIEKNNQKRSLYIKYF